MMEVLNRFKEAFGSLIRRVPNSSRRRSTSSRPHPAGIKGNSKAKIGTQMADTSLNTFLRESKGAFLNALTTNQAGAWTVVMGNEAGGALV
jgi:hypothetical protein